MRCGAWLEGLEEFDQGVFGLAPGDALALDPQARILLEQVQVGRKAHLYSCLIVLALHSPAPLMLLCRRLREHLENCRSSRAPAPEFTWAACIQNFWTLCLNLWCAPSASRTPTLTCGKERR